MIKRLVSIAVAGVSSVAAKYGVDGVVGNIVGAEVNKRTVDIRHINFLAVNKKLGVIIIIVTV